MKEQQKPVIKPKAARYEQRTQAKLDFAVSARNPSARCPYCHEDVRVQDEKQACNACMSWHHKECIEDYGRCVVCGLKPEVTQPARATEVTSEALSSTSDLKCCGGCEAMIKDTALRCPECGHRDIGQGVAVVMFLVGLSYLSFLSFGSSSPLFVVGGVLLGLFNLLLLIAWTSEFVFGVDLLEDETAKT